MAGIYIYIYMGVGSSIHYGVLGMKHSSSELSAKATFTNSCWLWNCSRSQQWPLSLSVTHRRHWGWWDQRGKKLWSLALTCKVSCRAPISSCHVRTLDCRASFSCLPLFQATQSSCPQLGLLFIPTEPPICGTLHTKQARSFSCQSEVSRLPTGGKANINDNLKAFPRIQGGSHKVCQQPLWWPYSSWEMFSCF